jgi:hypothetical protein
MDKTWNGDVVALNPPFNREITITLDRCSLDEMWFRNRMCATVRHWGGWGEPINGTAGYNTMVQCQPHFQGANPVVGGACFEFNEFLKDTRFGPDFEIELYGPDPPVDNMYNWGYWVISEQRNGSLFWTYLQGNVAVANAYLQ